MTRTQYIEHKKSYGWTTLQQNDSIPLLLTHPKKKREQFIVTARGFQEQYFNNFKFINYGRLQKFTEYELVNNKLQKKEQ